MRKRERESASERAREKIQERERVIYDNDGSRDDEKSWLVIRRESRRHVREGTNRRFVKKKKKREIKKKNKRRNK